MIVRRGAAALLFALTTSAAAAAQVVAPAELQGVVARIRADASPRLGHETVHAPALIARLYERRAFAPVWDSVRGVGLLHALRGLAADGLEPLDYHLAVLESDGANPQPPARAAELDVLRTDALLRAAYDLRFGRVDARTMRRRTDLSRALTGTNADAAAALLLDMHPASALERVRPGHFVYRGLRDALRHLEQVRGDGGWATIPPGRLSLDSINARVPLLRRRLAQDGDLQGDTVSSHFDATVDSAVRRFQHRHGLNDDGIVGPATLAALNVSVTRRIDAVRVNLERARWVVHDLAGTFIAVNAAGAVVYFVRDSVVTFESRVIVGREYTRTPVFSAALRHIDLNPTWTVPPGIVGEVLAAARRDAGYLSRQGIEVLDAAGRAVSVDVSRYSAATFPYTFRQRPGPLNPLGQVKFVLPNAYNVYLHDTPARSLFASEQRTFSHGCIRVSNPLDLAALVLDTPRWSVEALRAAIATGATRTIPLARPVPVLILYWTASADLHGELHFYADVYDRDPALLRALNTR